MYDQSLLVKGAKLTYPLFPLLDSVVTDSKGLLYIKYYSTFIALYPISKQNNERGIVFSYGTRNRTTVIVICNFSKIRSV